MWKGTAEQYYDLYAAASKHLKKCFGDSIKVGGYSSTGAAYKNQVSEKDVTLAIGLKLKAILESRGAERDRGDAFLHGHVFDGGIAGFDPDAARPMDGDSHAHVRAALGEARVLRVCVRAFDGSTGEKVRLRRQAIL